MTKKKKATQKSFSRIGLISAALVGVAATGMLMFGRAKPVQVPLYEVTRVFDGDTFETKEKQYIRLSGVDAPELDRCGSDEAANALEKLVVGKKVYIKVLYHQGARSNGLVYTEDGLVNAAMLRLGWATVNDRDNVDLPELATATREARDKKIGIFSSVCTQSTNAAHPSCTIKGNFKNDQNKTYHLPGCRSYTLTDVQLYRGDLWFCTEKEAKVAGFIKASQCP